MKSSQQLYDTQQLDKYSKCCIIRDSTKFERAGTYYFLALRPRSRQGTPTAFWEGREHQRYSKAKENPSPRRSAYRRFILGHGVAAAPKLARPWYRWRFLVTGRVGERDGGDFDAESVHSVPTEKRSSLHGGGETDKTGDTTGAFAIFLTFKWQALTSRLPRLLGI